MEMGCRVLRQFSALTDCPCLISVMPDCFLACRSALKRETLELRRCGLKTRRESSGIVVGVRGSVPFTCDLPLPPSILA